MTLAVKIYIKILLSKIFNFYLGFRNHLPDLVFSYIKGTAKFQELHNLKILWIGI